MSTQIDLVNQGRMLSTDQVAEMWHMSRQALWRLSNAKNHDKRVPSYKVGGKRLFKFDELMWYLDKHKTTPNETPPRRTR